MQDVNIFVTTDTHAWLAGRDPHEPLYNATAADVVDVVEAARAAAAERGHDVLFFDNGDVIDGTGLSATAADHADYVAPLLATLPYDALNCGNHELYQLDFHGANPSAPACAAAGDAPAGDAPW